MYTSCSALAAHAMGCAMAGVPKSWHSIAVTPADTEIERMKPKQNFLSVHQFTHCEPTRTPSGTIRICISPLALALV